MSYEELEKLNSELNELKEDNNEMFAFLNSIEPEDLLSVCCKYKFENILVFLIFNIWSSPFGDKYSHNPHRLDRYNNALDILIKYNKKEDLKFIRSATSEINGFESWVDNLIANYYLNN